MLPGADIGIKYYIYPDISRLADVNVWVDAACELFDNDFFYFQL